jgi:hypothetical protein
MYYCNLVKQILLLKIKSWKETRSRNSNRIRNVSLFSFRFVFVVSQKFRSVSFPFHRNFVLFRFVSWPWHFRFVTENFPFRFVSFHKPCILEKKNSMHKALDFNLTMSTHTKFIQSFRSIFKRKFIHLTKVVSKICYVGSFLKIYNFKPNHYHLSPEIYWLTWMEHASRKRSWDRQFADSR